LRTLILIAALPILAGCINRTMHIETDPPGAVVWVDGDEYGKTPVDVHFTSYGSREVFLQMPDHATKREVVKLRAPWYAWFPVDFAADVLCPFTLQDRQSFAFTMEPLPPADVKALEGRAGAFREKALRALAEERKRRGLPEQPPTARHAGP